MAKIQLLKTMVQERLTVAAEEILGFFERTIVLYEEEIDRQRKLLDLVFEPDRSRRSDTPQLLYWEEDVLQEQPERRPSSTQEDTESFHMKGEGEELLSSQEEEPPQDLDGVEDTAFTFPSLSVKREHREKPQCSRLSQTQSKDEREADPLPSTSAEPVKTESDREDHTPSEPTSDTDPGCRFEPSGDEQPLTSNYPESKTCDGNTWRETGKPISGLNLPGPRKIQRVKGQCLPISSKLKQPIEASQEQRSPNKLPETLLSKDWDKPFPNDVLLTEHGKVHRSNFDFCERQFEPAGSLDHYIQAHRTCQVCGEIFFSSEALVIHSRSHALDNPAIFPDCGKRLDPKDIMNKPARVNSVERPFSCSFCREAFSQKGHLKIHMRVHTGEKPFSCTICGKRFSQNGTLVIHMRSHTGEKPFGCSVCGKRFSQSGSLAAHMRSHTGEKPFVCTVCNKRFTQSGSLATHMRSHTGEKPFGCSLCGKSFGQKVHLQTHMRCHSASFDM